MRTRRILLVAAGACAALASIAGATELIEFCGFRIERPTGWEAVRSQDGKVLLLRPSCWCDLVEGPSPEGEGPLFINRGPAPITLLCTELSVDDLLNPSGSLIEGVGWLGFSESVNHRQYYWGGGFAGSTFRWNAWLFPLAAREPVMSLQFVGEGHDLDPDIFVLLIEYPSFDDAQ
jgi:hypothetical protein